MKASPLRAFLCILWMAPAVAHAEEHRHAPVWMLSDADSTVFLAGSIHLLRETDLPMPEAFERVYLEAEELVFEIDMATMTNPGTAAEVRRLGSLPEGESLSSHFSETTISRLREYLVERGLPVNSFENCAPGMVFLLLSSFEASRQGARPEFGLETIYFGKSLRDHKPSRGLETLAFQISRLNGFEPAMMEDLINEALDESAKSGEKLDSIISAWRSGDEEKLASVILDDSSFTPQLKKALLTDRNRNWVPEIVKSLATDRDVLFLVGAAHLVGDESVVALLREKGYVVTQLAISE